MTELKQHLERLAERFDWAFDNGDWDVIDTYVVSCVLRDLVDQEDETDEVEE